VKRIHPGIIVLIIIVIIATGIIGGIFIYKANDYVRLTDINYSAVVNSDGSVSVTEKVTYDVHAARKNNAMWELWVGLPELYDEYKFTYEIESVTRLTVNGQSDYLVFGEAAMLYWDDIDFATGYNKWFYSKGTLNKSVRQYECLLIYVNGLYREKTEFEIKYKVKGDAVVKYADCTELYLNIFEGKNCKYLRSVKADITVPAASGYRVNTYGTNSHKFNDLLKSSDNGGNTVYSFELDKSRLKFKPYNRYIDFQIVSFGEDKHALAPAIKNTSDAGKFIYMDILKAQKDWDNMPTAFLKAKIILLVIFAGLSALVIIIFFVVNKMRKKKYNVPKPEVDYDLYREIPGGLDIGLAGYLVFSKHRISDNIPGIFPAVLLSLARKKYITAEMKDQSKGWEPSNVVITVIYEVSEGVSRKELTVTEQNYLNLIRRYTPKGTISVKNLQGNIKMDSQNTYMFITQEKTDIKRTGVSSNYFRQPDIKTHKRKATMTGYVLIFLGLFIMGITNLFVLSRLDLAFGAFLIFGASIAAVGIMGIIFSKDYVMLTQLGQNEYAKWRGLYNFLKHDTLMKEHRVQHIDIWEEYLIYATACGIPDKVLKAIDVRFGSYNSGNSRIIRHPFLCRGIHIRSTGRGFSSASRSASSKARGGFGGRGAGGGGGGH